MQDFDAGVVDTDRQFKIAGQTYTVRKRVRPEVLAMLGEFEADSTFKHTIEQLDAMILATLTRESAERWHAMRTSDDDEDGEGTVDLEGMNAVLEFAIEAVTNRPLGSAGSSTTGIEPTAATSPVPSSSLAAVPSTG